MKEIFKKLGIEEVNSGAYCGEWLDTSGEIIEVFSPIDDSLIAKVKSASVEDYDTVSKKAQEDFKTWKMIPAPKRGEIIRQIGLELRKYKDELGKLVTIEMGKIHTEGLGEVQEMIDMADFAVGLSRQLYGNTMMSERPNHRMYEQWHPLGVIGIISAFNFPVAVWAWNAFIAGVCGDTMIWKPSSSTPLTSIAITNIVHKVMERNDVPKAIFNLIIGRGSTIGERLINDKAIPLISATGSCYMGLKVHQAAAKRYGQVILELGGNNGIIVMEDTNLELTLKAVLFGAVGTAGQRCTTTRRILLHEKIFDMFAEKLKKAYSSIPIGDPLEDGILMGPLVDYSAVTEYLNALEIIKKQGGKIIYGGKVLKDTLGKCYVEPTIVIAKNDMPIVQEETFAPILYLIRIKDIDEAIKFHNDVP
ncbi:MAG: aldehyde dehydrogenase family protein, partial [Candidatus Cloacimonetes bacterium]|nr:aldehyde dehydrogenase family protein [Candidatus Cloacimonadota bacterium]